MCGIAGYLGRFGQDELESMCESLSHRGPDGSGTWRDPEHGIGLAHRRLSIIDVSDAAAQPMAGVGGRYRVTFNGEIYNFRALAEELKRAGYVFNENSDTAVLAPLYDMLGAGMLPRLHGIFAFAIWDRRERRLFVARDQIGVKPLYYSTLRKGLAFASELRALRLLDGFSDDLDEAALAAYLTFLWSPGEGTPFRAVRKLRPGHFIEATSAGVRIEKWYTPPLMGDAGADRSSLADLPGKLTDVVAEQLVSDVPVGAFLSGGVDSTAVVACMIEAKRPPAQSYCVAFDGASMVEEGFGDDWTYAERFATRHGIPLRRIVSRVPGPDDLTGLVSMLEEPQADLAPLLVKEIAEAARGDGIKVLMSGAGGDDVFSGYRRHSAAWARQSFAAAAPALGLLAKVAAPLGGSVLRRRLDRLAWMLESSREEFLVRAFQFNATPLVQEIAGPALSGRAGSVPPVFRDTLARMPADATTLSQMLALEMQGFVPDHNLNYTDKASMSEGVEVRVPLLDVSLVQFAAGLRASEFVRRGSAKWGLRKALRGLVPDEILDRKKTGFGVPLRSWMAGPLKGFVLDTFGSRRFAERGLFDAAAVRSLYDRTASGRVDGAYLLFSILMIELWCQVFVDQRPVARAPVQAMAS